VRLEGTMQNGTLVVADSVSAVQQTAPAALEAGAPRLAASPSMHNTAVVLFGVLVVIDAPPLARLLVAAPAIIAASGYLQAWLKFCAGFGSAGVFNFGDVGTTESVADAAAKRADRRRALQIGAASFAIGIAVGIVAVLLPV